MTTISTTVTFADLRAAYDEELAELREGYEETVSYIRDEWGDDALDRPIPTDLDTLDDEELEHLAAMRATAAAYEQSGKQIQQRNNALDRLGDLLDSHEFEVKMLTGTELMDIETDLKLKAQAKDVDVAVVEHYRKGLVVDMATIEAPDDIPRDDNGSPTPSEAGHPLTLALYEAVESLNQAGAVDFRAPGFGEDDRRLTPAVESSASPSRSGDVLPPVDAAKGTPETTSPPPGDS